MRKIVRVCGRQYARRGERRRDAHLNKSTGNPDASQYLTDAWIEARLIDVTYSANESPKEDQVEGERSQLQCQANKEYVHANVLRVALPVPRRCDPAACGLCKEAEDVAANEDPPKPARVDAKEDLLWAGREAEVDEVLEEQIECSANEDGGDDDVAG